MIIKVGYVNLLPKRAVMGITFIIRSVLTPVKVIATWIL